MDQIIQPRTYLDYRKEELNSLLIRIKAEKESAIIKENYDLAILARDKEKKVIERIQEIQ